MGRGRAPQKKGGGKSQGSRKGRGGAIKFAQDVRSELGKVTWPDREQLRQSTAVVLIIVVTLGVYVAAWDFVFRNLARLIFF